MSSGKLMQQALRHREPSRDGRGRYQLVRDLDANVAHFNEVLGVGKSYDVILRRMRIDDVDIAIYSINGLFLNIDDIEILRGISWSDARGTRDGEEGNRLGILRSLLEAKLQHSQVYVVDDFDEAILQVLSGPLIVLVDGEAAAIKVDIRNYPDRSPSPPAVEQLVLGPQDGFVENIIMNSALIRRRVRDPGLRFEIVEVGRRSKTDVAVGYIEGLTDPGLVEAVKRRLKAIVIDGVPSAEQTVSEFLSRQPWNPFPTARKTIRPDIAATNLFDGHVVLLVDTSPVALVAPVSLFQLMQNPEDYHVAPVYGTYLRWIEAYSFVWATLVPPVWLLLATHPALLQHIPALSFIGPKTPGKLPLPLQFLLAEATIDVLRRAILNSPSALATSFGILGAVILGQVATKAGLFTPEALVYMVAAAIAAFAMSNLELGMALRMMRVTLILLEWLWALPGLVLGVLFWLVMAARTDSLGVPYLWPLSPFNWPALRSILLREPATARAPRPLIMSPLDRWRSAR